MRAGWLLVCVPALVTVAALAGGCSSDAPASSGDESSNGGGAAGGHPASGTPSSGGTPSTGTPGAPGTPTGGGDTGGDVDAGTGNGNGSDASTAGHHDSGTPGTDAGGGASNDCTSPNLVWKTANKTNYESYPAPGSPECVQYNGCAYEGQFSSCSNTETQSWVKAHNIVSVFPNLNKASNGIAALSLHDLCLKSGSKTIVVTVLDECADSDCSGCCTENKGGEDELIDIESFTDARFGVDDGKIEWADLGPTKGAGCK